VGLIGIDGSPLRNDQAGRVRASVNKTAQDAKRKQRHCNDQERIARSFIRTSPRLTA